MATPKGGPTRSLLRDPPGAAPSGERLADGIRRLTNELRKVRQLLTQQQETNADSEDPVGN